MLATRIRQKDGIFYFASCPAKEILSKVRFISRYYGEDEQIAAQTVPHAPQFARSLITSRQVPLQSVRPAPHDTAHAPAEQTRPAEQTVPHAPQFRLSVSPSRHAPPQLV